MRQTWLYCFIKAQAPRYCQPAPPFRRHGMERQVLSVHRRLTRPVRASTSDFFGPAILQDSLVISTAPISSGLRIWAPRKTRNCSTTTASTRLGSYSPILARWRSRPIGAHSATDAKFEGVPLRPGLPMCGIAGFVLLDQPAQPARVQAMCDRTRHRVDQDEGVHVDRGCAIGMRRLSIIDLSTGHQPISNEDGSVWIVFNGEIYNYQE